MLILNTQTRSTYLLTYYYKQVKIENKKKFKL
jgi:hypothetical protein